MRAASIFTARFCNLFYLSCAALCLVTSGTCASGSSPPLQLLPDHRSQREWWSVGAEFHEIADQLPLLTEPIDLTAKGTWRQRQLREQLPEYDDPASASSGRRGRHKPKQLPATSQLEQLHDQSARVSTLVMQGDEYEYDDEEAQDDYDEAVKPEKVHKTALEQESRANFGKEVSEAVVDPLPHAVQQLKVCVVSADFWGMKAAGGTATAYHLLAGVLAGNPSLNVTFLGASDKTAMCAEARAVNSKFGVDFVCLEQRHFEPEVVETFPYERLSHAVLAWLLEDPHRCDVLHGHEWGGAFVDVITALHFRQVRPGVRMAVEPHGGHFWSTQGQIQRPMDVVSLRIDNAERMANQLNDFEISPTNYMTAFLRQRGWKLPASTITIPNVIPQVEPDALAMMGKEKAVWRVAFFSRLEERKGIKLFTDAVSSLNVTGLPKFEVFFVGSEAKIDMRPSSVWLKEVTSKWPWKTHLKVGASRDEALEILAREGVLLVLCSLIDNMPYVVAEAAVKGIPFLVFDVGGTLEMFDGKLHANNVVQEPTLEALSSKLSQVLQRGSITTIKLSDPVTNGRQRWMQWHSDFIKLLPGLVTEDKQLEQQLSQAPAPEAAVQVVKVNSSHNALDLWEQLCKDQDPQTSQPYLLLPPEYDFLDPQTGPQELWRLTTTAVQRGSPMRALTIGAVLPDGKHSFPTSPTWMLYGSDSVHCIENTPVLINPPDFCSAFLAEARVFRHYYTWVLAMLLHQQDMQLHTFPKPMFKVLNFTMQGYSCVPDKVPVDRALTFPIASNLYRDAEELLRNLHLAPFSKPMVSLVDDFPVQQRHKGWQFGYLASNTSDEVTFLKWRHADTGVVRDGKWSCGSTAHDYPSMQHSLLHPCANPEGTCCGNSVHAPFVLRYESFFHSRAALLVLAYEVWPTCGDGLDFVVKLRPTGPKKPRVLLRRSYEPDPNGQPNRQKIEWRLHIRTGDIVDFIVEPRSNHDCDGLYIVDVSIWTDAAIVQTASQ